MLLGIIGAMNEEVIQLKEVMNLLETKEIGGYNFFKGTLLNKEVVLVECGIGKVNAAICSTLLIQEFKVDKVLFTGVAGGLNPEINIGDIVISTDLVEHDFDCTAFGYDYGVIPRMENSTFKADETLVNLAKRVAANNFGSERVFVGTIVSGDTFVASNDKIKWLRDTFKGECTEMEGAAVAHVCYVLGKPFVIIRSISDKANHDANMNFDEFVKLAAQNSKLIIEGMLKEI
ncbi:5'-methylthioadenosine/adenosylhomocysteine nucleosidase [Cetobacterium somerae]|uniref:5'-methylthioadenosine/adenosylhomocysteine nucleosidase n=1 Tax=Cetobacterium sp. NK01 TaxID=2993530 RepID=UPI0021162F06|nr:5'-methylthioadenosine/adenosylhomocysteine nucleosidase [Cetobacterium sp. NK01]MCQ8211543.1 5'-methylthioadenosine/adenosylhomocysteine nucleosidase [Cetobacterium sp. NK01]